MTTQKLDLSITPEQEERIRRLAESMPPWETYSAEHLERVRLVCAKQSLSSPLYRKKAEELGMEEYLRTYTTSRVR